MPQSQNHTSSEIECKAPKIGRSRRIQPVTSVEPIQRQHQWKYGVQREIFQSHNKTLRSASRESSVGKEPTDLIFRCKGLPNIKLKIGKYPTINNELQEVPLQTSLHNSVNLQSEGALICLDEQQEPKSIVTASANELKQKQLSSRKGRALGAWRWLIKPFCTQLRRRKRNKPPAKIQAVIYKTYFVRWTKPPDAVLTKNQQYEQSNTSKPSLRRIRSALF